MVCAPIITPHQLKYVAKFICNAPTKLLNSLRDSNGNINFHQSSIWFQLLPPSELYRHRSAEEITKILKNCPELWHELCESFLTFHGWSQGEARAQLEFLAEITQNDDVPKSLTSLCILNKQDVVNLRMKNTAVITSIVEVFFCFLRKFSKENLLHVHFASPRAFQADNEMFKINYLTAFASHFISVPKDVRIIIVPHLTSNSLPNGEQGVAHWILLICDVIKAKVQVYDPMGEVFENKYSGEAEVLAEALTIYFKQKSGWNVEKKPFLSIRQEDYSKDCCPAICFTARLIADLFAEGVEKKVNDLKISSHFVQMTDFVEVREYLGDTVAGYSNCTTPRSKNIFRKSEAASWEVIRSFVQSVG